MAAARDLLQRLGALDAGNAITPSGKRMLTIGTHPRLAAMLLSAQNDIETALACDLAALLEARDADTGHRVRLVMAALIHARREFTYEIDAVSLMLVSEQWIPVEGVHELPLIDTLVSGIQNTCS